MKTTFTKISTLFVALALLVSCRHEETKKPTTTTTAIQTSTITVENELDAKPLVESGTFKGTATPIIFPGESASFSFYAGKGQRLSFATMYGWSSDLFFAPENPGIKLFNDDGTPITGDVSSQIKLWDNGTRVNQVPGKNITRPGTAETTIKNIKEVNGTDDFGNTYLPASSLMHATLVYNGNSKFTITITNSSGGTANTTPFSPGVWAVSYAPGGNILEPNPIYEPGKPTANGLTELSETGNNTVLNTYLTGKTGIFTPLSPVLVVVYHGSENPFYKTGEKDRGEGLKELSQMGNADILANALKSKPEVRSVYVLKDATNKILLPKIDGKEGGKVSQKFDYVNGDKIAIATMYGLSNDWFFATKSGDIDASQKGDFSSKIGLYDSGTAVDQFPGAGVKISINGAPVIESKNIEAVPNPNPFTTLPNNIVKVTIQ